MKLEAVMENLQRQQAARLALEEKLRQAEKEKDLRSMVESQIHQQALAFRHYQAAVRGALAAGVAAHSPPEVTLHRTGEDESFSRRSSDDKEEEEEEDMEEQELMDEEEEEEDEDGLNHYQPRRPELQGPAGPVHLLPRLPPSFGPPRRPDSPGGNPQSQHHEWTYEEQFKQVGPQHEPEPALRTCTRTHVRAFHFFSMCGMSVLLSSDS